MSVILFVMIFLAALAPVSTRAQDALPWWERSNEGWHFYNETSLLEEPEEKPAASPEPSFPEQALASQLFTDRMKQKGEELLSRAMENPTPENVTALMEHNQAMMRLSSNFSLLWQKVLMAQPELAMATPSDMDKDLYWQVTKGEERDRIISLTRQAGILFIYSTGCPYCRRQADYLARFIGQYPFYVKAVSLDGGVFPQFPATEPDNGISRTLGVETVPAIFLAFPPDRFERIATGLTGPDELERRLLYYVQEPE